jgi:hypothetical protein
MDNLHTVDELTRLLQEEKQRADNTERGRQEEKQRAENAERGRQEEKQRADNAEREHREEREKHRLTTLDEYIAATHELVFARLKVEPNEQLRAKGSITNPKSKPCPTRLRPWPDFLEQQRVALENLYTTFPVADRLFEVPELFRQPWSKDLPASHSG